MKGGKSRTEVLLLDKSGQNEPVCSLDFVGSLISWFAGLLIC